MYTPFSDSHFGMNWPQTAMLILEIVGVIGLLWKIRAFQYLKYCREKAIVAAIAWKIRAFQYLKYRREKAIVAAIAFAIVVPITFGAYEVWGWRIEEQWLVHRIAKCRGKAGLDNFYEVLELELELKLLRLNNSSDPSEREEATRLRLIMEGKRPSKYFMSETIEALKILAAADNGERA